ncbi:MAG: metal ABC transporter substrate-binding protein [Treponemataceae bacterium]
MRIVVLVLSAFFLFSCNKTQPENTHEPQKITVVTTLFPVYDFVQNIATEKVTTILLGNTGGQVHSFEPSPKDIKVIKNASILIYTGGESDARFTHALKASKQSNTQKILRLFDFLDLLPIDESFLSTEKDIHTAANHPADEHLDDSQYDEHVLTSLVNAQKTVITIAQILGEVDSENEIFYTKNAQSYAELLALFHSDFENLVKNAPRKVIAIADKFPLRYFAHDYNLQYHALFDTCSTQTEPSASKITKLIKKINNEAIPTVFYMELTNNSLAKMIARETGAKVSTLNAYHTVSSKEFAQGISYLDLVKQNYNALKEALY